MESYHHMHDGLDLRRVLDIVIDVTLVANKITFPERCVFFPGTDTD